MDVYGGNILLLLMLFFRSNFYGGGHKIKNLYINRPDMDYIGLFGNYVNIDNLEIENCNITGKNNFGGIVGYFGIPCPISSEEYKYRRKITDCKVSGKIVGESSAVV
jgi:hypothetical protein